jgi:hypothetical protein
VDLFESRHIFFERESQISYRLTASAFGFLAIQRYRGERSERAEGGEGNGDKRLTFKARKKLA